MTDERIRQILMRGENIAVEFKRCGSGIEHDAYESVCAFLNRFGGDLFLGIEDNGTVRGVSSNNAPFLVRSFINTVSNPELFLPTVYLEPEIVEYDGRTLIHVFVPPSSEVHAYKRVIYDRSGDADVKVTSSSHIAALYIRKQNIFTEKRVFPYVDLADLRTDLLPRVRILAANNAGGTHPWQSMDDRELLQSAGLFGVDRATGERGYNLAAVMLLGRDNVITDVCPAYETDALLRRVNVDRYDDREIVKTNLIESYPLLMEFARKHLPDPFFLEDDMRKSLRNIIAREMLVNTLIHREYTSSYTAKFVIEKTRMYVENACRASREGVITPDNLEPCPKNPIIASFFRIIGHADKLGSGVRNLYKYVRAYSGGEPQIIEGDVFRIIVPLDEKLISESGPKQEVDNDTKDKTGDTKGNPAAIVDDEQNVIQRTGNADTIIDTKDALGDTKGMASDTKETQNILSDLSKRNLDVLRLLAQNPELNRAEISRLLSVSTSTVSRALSTLEKKNLIRRKGGRRYGKWIVLFLPENE